MADLTPDRLAELRRIAEAATRCPECGVVWSLGRDVGGRVHTPGGIDCLHRQLTAARAEAKLWKRRHDALRAAVIKAEADYASRADGLDDALMILRQLLAESGGGGDERV